MSYITYVLDMISYDLNKQNVCILVYNMRQGRWTERNSVVVYVHDVLGNHYKLTRSVWIKNNWQNICAFILGPKSIFIPA